MTAQVEIQWEAPGEALTIHVSDARITAEKPLRVELELQKFPLPQFKTEETSFPLGTVMVDNEPAVSLLREKATTLRHIDERERVGSLLQMTRDALSYISSNEIDRLSEERNLGVALSDYIGYGRGNCRHFAALFALLAQAARLEVIVVGCYGGQLTNIIRNDNGQPLFKTVPLGKVGVPHVWNEIRFKGNYWVSMDATTGINGLDSVQRRIFDEASYLHNASPHLLVMVDEETNHRISYRLPIEFKVGEPGTTALLEIFDVGGKEYHESLRFIVKANPHPSMMGIKILKADVI